MKISIVLTWIFTFLLISIPVNAFVTTEDILANADCSPDGNDNHLDATIIDQTHIGTGCVNPGDSFDWYKFPGQGYVDWNGSLVIFSDEPGLVYRLYLDRGNQLELVTERELTYESRVDLYASVISIQDECQSAGFVAPINGDFYFRITHYSSYQQNHPYIIRTLFNAAPSDPGPPTTNQNARELPPGESRYGTLTQTDFYDSFYWDQPSGGNADGLIELVVMRAYYPEDDPGVELMLFENGHLLATGSLDSNTGYGFIDLSGLNIYPGRYQIYVGLESSTNSPGVSYRLINRSAESGNPGGPDTNIDPASAVTLNPGVQVSSNLCTPWDTQDFYEFEWDYWFLGDVVINSVDDQMPGIPTLLTGGGNEILNSGSFHGLSFEDNPVYAENYVVRFEATPQTSGRRDYTITFYPNGTGPYRAPGHGIWQDPDDMLQYTEYGNFKHEYTFELDYQTQDKYFLSASTSTGMFLNGIVEIYGSTDDYKLVIGRLGPNGPLWGQTIYPDVRGKTVLDFGYQILTLPGEYVLKIELDGPVSSRRRFYMKQHLSILECWEEPSEGLDNAWSQLYYIDGKRGFNGVLCWPSDISDFGEFKIDPNLKVGIPQGYMMTLQGGYPGMRFWLYDSNDISIWSGEIEELGGYLNVYLENLVQDGETYILRVSAYPEEERLMVWSAEFSWPIRFRPLEVYRPRSIIEIDVGEIRGLLGTL